MTKDDIRLIRNLISLQFSPPFPTLSLYTPPTGKQLTTIMASFLAFPSGKPESSISFQSLQHPNSRRHSCLGGVLKPVN